MRVQHPYLSSSTAKMLSFSFNLKSYQAREGDTISVALWANGVKVLRSSEKNGEPRGMYCGIGQCYECRIYHPEIGMVKACTTLIQENEQYFSRPSEGEWAGDEI